MFSVPGFLLIYPGTLQALEILENICSLIHTTDEWWWICVKFEADKHEGVVDLFQALCQLIFSNASSLPLFHPRTRLTLHE
jgi:hypothetical protein